MAGLAQQGRWQSASVRDQKQNSKATSWPCLTVAVVKHLNIHDCEM